MKSFDVDFLHFLAQLSTFLFSVARCLFLFILYLPSDTSIKSKYLEELKENSNIVQKNSVIERIKSKTKRMKKNLKKKKKNDQKLIIEKS